MKNAKFVESVTEKLTVKGVLVDSDDEVIICLDDDKDEVEVRVSDCLKKFKGKEITLSISTKNDTEEDFPEEVEE